MIEDAYRYFCMLPHDLMKLTPREYGYLLRGYTERQLDIYDKEVEYLLKQRVANNKEKLKPTDLFKRPKLLTIEEAEQERKAIANKFKQQQERMAALNLHFLNGE